MSKIVIVFLTLFTLSARASDLDWRSTNVNIYGRITKQIISLLPVPGQGHPQSITINSSGGDMETAMAIGEWIHANGVNVVVRGVCASACADYIFPAGVHKVIEDGSLVVWHGDLDQKNIRESQSKYEQAVQSVSISLENKELLDFINKNRRQYEYIKELRERQRRLYGVLGVDGYITRIGQEPTNFAGHDWTTTVDVMNKFGIKNVVAPESYGTPGYLSKVGNGIYDGKVISVIADGDHTYQLGNP